MRAHMCGSLNEMCLAWRTRVHIFSSLFLTANLRTVLGCTYGEAGASEWSARVCPSAKPPGAACVFVKPTAARDDVCAVF